MTLSWKPPRNSASSTLKWDFNSLNLEQLNQLKLVLTSWTSLCKLIDLEFWFSFQIIVWGDYGRMDRKVFMGVVQILLDDLDLSNLCMGWYKLFSTSSMCDPPLPSSSPLGGSPKKSPGPSPRSSMAHGASPRMSPLPTIMPPAGHSPRGHDYDDPDGDYV